jgi:hypothetical protein
MWGQNTWVKIINYFVDFVVCNSYIKREEKKFIQIAGSYSRRTGATKAYQSQGRDGK